MNNDIARANEVEGFLTKRQGKALYAMAQHAQKGIVEIGSWKGRSTSFLGLGSKSGHQVPVYAVDHLTGSREHREKFGTVDTSTEFERAMIRLDITNIVHAVRKSSEDAVQSFHGDIDLLFVDGSHEYPDVFHDITEWGKFLVHGGTIAVHDVTGYKGSKGPRDVSILEILHSDHYRNPRMVGSMLIAEKTDHIKDLDRIANERMARWIRFIDPVSW